MVDREVIVSGGRRLLVRDHGDPSNLAVLVFDGTPGSRLLFAEEVASAERHAIRLISYDRPGYGGSGPWPGRTVGIASRMFARLPTALASNGVVSGASPEERGPLVGHDATVGIRA